MPPQIYNSWQYFALRTHRDKWQALADDWRLYRGDDRDAYECWNSSNATWDFYGAIRFLSGLTLSGSITLADDTDLLLGDDGDAAIRWSTGDSSNHALVIGVGDTSQQIHITDKAARATDWSRSAGTHPELAIHSNTTPATDYLAIGNHDGTGANINVAGGTLLDLQFGGVTTGRFSNATISAYAAAADTDGADLLLRTQDGGAVTTGNPGRPSGSINLTVGSASPGASGEDQNGGTGDAINLTAGAAGDAGLIVGGTANGGTGGALILTGGAGGDGGDASGQDGNGGPIRLITGAKGSGGATGGVDGRIELNIGGSGVGGIRIHNAAITGFAGATGVAGGDVYVETQDGGAAASDSNGVAGGLLNIKCGDGSLKHGTGTTGGAGGAATYQAGAGAAGSATGTGGAGGAATLAAGSGGGTSGAGTGGAGGNVTLTPGAGGTTTGGTDGAPGALVLTRGIFRGPGYQTIDMNDSAVTLTLVPGTPTGTLLTSNVLAVDANSSGAGENLLMPPIADCSGGTWLIYNTGGETINLQNDGGGAIIAIATGETGLASCNGTSWVGRNW